MRQTVVAIALSSRVLFATGQGPAESIAGSSAFQAVAIKENHSGDRFSFVSPAPGGRFRAVNAPLVRIMVFAYGIPESRLVGIAPWIRTERFDIEATTSGEMPFEKLRMAVAGMLADRFKVAIHREIRESPIYTLVLSRSDRKLGLALALSEIDCPAAAAAVRAATLDAQKNGEAPPRPPSIGRGVRPTCGLVVADHSLQGTGARMSELASSLSCCVGRMVVDRTGLAGVFDFEVRWAWDVRNGQPSADAASTPDGGLSIFAALQDQFGLKLDPDRGPVEYVVVDRVDRPTPN